MITKASGSSFSVIQQILRPCALPNLWHSKTLRQIRALSTELLGLSIDQVFSHIKWTQWIEEKLGVKIEFPIIADDAGTIALKLGMVHPGKGTNTVRAVFVIDPKGIIRSILYYPQELGRNMDEILRMVEALQLGDKEGVNTPANWPNNELIQDSVIIPPAQDVFTAEKRTSEYENFDWWFCYEEGKVPPQAPPKTWEGLMIPSNHATGLKD